jgi:lipopolysaccharide export system protein LptC
MSQQADQIRDRRQAFAAPGSPLDRAVRVLAVALPALVGAVFATMLIAPLSPRGEVSFLLDRNKVDVSEDRLRVDNAMYRGEDKRGRPFSLSAGEAVQASALVPEVRLEDLTARMLLSDGPAVLSAPAGRYNIEAQRVAIDGLVSFVSADGYRLSARGVSIDLPGRSLRGEGRVGGSVPAGTFQADAISADLDARTVTLEGNARLRMVPGQLRIP